MINTVTAVAPKINLTETVKNYSKRLLGFIQKRVRNYSDAEDILQDVFYQLAETDSLMKPIDQLSAWLYTVTRNKITDHYRKKKTEALPNYMSYNEDDSFIDELEKLLPVDTNSPETEYLRALIWEELAKALSELPEEQRIVFELNEMEDIPFKEISELTGEPINTLISRKRYAVLYLRDRLFNIYNELLN
jgi:RNA polymerase sigma factor (sigma-70 family)